MTDRELLENAARSIDLKYEWKHDAYFGGEVGVVPEGYLRCWNPLENHTDAFDLMIELALRFEYFAIDPFTVSSKPVCVISWAPGGEKNRVLETLMETGDDASKVLRRAIVCAAAKIGSAM